MSRALILTGLAVAAILGGLDARRAAPRRQASAQRSGNVKIYLALPKDKFSPTEDVPLKVSVVNEGASPVELPDPFHRTNWQPTYTVTSPASPSGQTFSFRSATSPDKRLVPAGVTPVLVTLKPGDKLQSTLPFEQWAALRAPGRYKVDARLEWKGLSAHSDPLEFTIETASPKSLSLGLDRIPNPTTIGVLWLGKGGGKAPLYRSTFLEKRPDLGEVRRHSEDSVLEAPAVASDVLCPWTNYDRMEELVSWSAWREGAEFVAAAPLATPQRVSLGAEPQRVVRPALMTASGELDLFAVAHGGRELIHVRFQPPPEGAAPPGRVLARLALPATVESARVALSPAKLGGARHLILLTSEQGALSLHHLAIAGDEPAALATVAIPGAHALPFSEPDLWVNEMGETSAAVLVETNREQHSLALAEVRFGADGKALGPIGLKPLGELPAMARAATARYSVSARRPIRLDWAVLLESGELLHSQASGKPQRLSAPPAVPLELAPMAQATYVLTVPRSEGPRLEPLH